jgi:hypothetical protein
MSRRSHADDVATVSVMIRAGGNSRPVAQGQAAEDEEVCVTLTSISVSAAGTIATGSAVQLTATGRYSDASTVNLTSAVTWVSDTTSVATVTTGSGGGVVTGVAVGTSVVHCSFQGISSDTTTANVIQAIVTQRIRMVTPYSTSTLGVNFSQWLPQWLPADATNVKLMLSNRNVAEAANDGPEITGVNVAIYRSNGLGSPTGSALYSVTNQTVPTGSDDLTLTLTGFDASTWRGVDGKIIVAIGVPTGTEITGNTNITQGLRNTSSATVSSIPSLSQSDSSILCVSLLVDTANEPIIIRGDSLSQGYDTSHAADGGFVYAWPTLLADNEYVVDNNGISGSELSQWNDTVGRPYYTLGQYITGRKIVVALSINDLDNLSGATNQAKADDFMSRVTEQLADLQTAGADSDDIYWVNLTASAAYSAQNAIRLLINADLVTTLGTAHVVDAAAIADDGSSLNALYDNGDGTHWNGALQALVKNAVLAKITA